MIGMNIHMMSVFYDWHECVTSVFYDWRECVMSVFYDWHEYTYDECVL